jgi:hypothetical protein
MALLESDKKDCAVTSAVELLAYVAVTVNGCVKGVPTLTFAAVLPGVIARLAGATQGFAPLPVPLEPLRPLLPPLLAPLLLPLPSDASFQPSKGPPSAVDIASDSGPVASFSKTEFPVAPSPVPHAAKHATDTIDAATNDETRREAFIE